MKRTLFLLFTFSITLSSCGHSNSIETEKLATTAKIWGFLKYYHPEVATGKFNWDKQLFEILPKVSTAKNKQELSKIYLEWINALGKVDMCNTCTTKENKNYFGKNFDLAWIKDTTLFSKELIAKLKFIEKNRFQGEHHYVSVGRAGNVIIENEPHYKNFSWENKNLRLLSLFRYWNYIEYFFPYKYQTDKDWDMVLKESIPNFYNSKTETDYHVALLELIVNINDSHGDFWTDLTVKHFGEYRLPAKFKIIDNKVIITGFYEVEIAKENDLQIGDVILKVDGKKIKDLLTIRDKYISGSNTSVKLRNAKGKLLSGSKETVTITFERNNIIQEKNIKRHPYYALKIEKSIDDTWKIFKNNIGYVNMGQLEKDDVKLVMDTLAGTKAIIFDIRNYPKGTMYPILEYLHKKPKVFAKFTKPDLSYIGKFNWAETYTCGRENPHSYSGKVILLVNETTQSHAEFTAMGLQTAENAITIGSQTSGADGNISMVRIIDNLYTVFSGIGVFYPNGKETQRIGIVPDINVLPTIEGVKKAQDEVLEKALEVALE
ncbi:peptidase S41 [Aureibaculum algae]|uniref:Peptidase S41 n=1 Tax=Aureibaculum algae TaxID=2584122 RepID=A0A5B7TVD7_9FLAO|nr:S41 family peptidase [Aureibaculum algae]QCX39254.1 peptidase S41 [Aureibaculum algae]